MAVCSGHGTDWTYLGIEVELDDISYVSSDTLGKVSEGAVCVADCDDLNETRFIWVCNTWWCGGLTGIQEGPAAFEYSGIVQVMWREDVDVRGSCGGEICERRGC